MSLKGFHVVLISLSSVLVMLFGGWSVHAWRAEGGTGHLVRAVLSFALGAALVVYVVWFARRIRSREEEERRRRRLIHPLAVLAAAFVAGTRPASACSSCFSEASGPWIDAARAGVWLLFGLVFAVQLAFLLFFLHLRRRARERQRPEFTAGPPQRPA
jgi:hypothetical protein